MIITPEELLAVHECITPKNLEIEKLKQEVVRLTGERDAWKARALAAEAPSGSEGKLPKNIIVISVKKLKTVLAKIHDVKMLSVFALILQKALSREDSADDCQVVADIVPLPQPPSLTLKTDGDINVEGDWNDVHDNAKVNFE